MQIDFRHDVVRFIIKSKNRDAIISSKLKISNALSTIDIIKSIASARARYDKFNATTYYNYKHKLHRSVKKCTINYYKDNSRHFSFGFLSEICLGKKIPAYFTYKITIMSNLFCR